MKTYSTLTETINALKSKGYNQDFNLHPEWIECPAMSAQFKPTEFHVDEVHRFEGMTNPDDSSVLYAISSSTGIKGVLIDAYGAYTEGVSPEMLARLKVDRSTYQ